MWRKEWSNTTARPAALCRPSACSAMPSLIIKRAPITHTKRDTKCNKRRNATTRYQAIASPLCDPYRIQTCNLLIRSQTLYSIELRDQFFVFSGAKILPFFELASILTHFFSKKISSSVTSRCYISQYQPVRIPKQLSVQEPCGERPDDENHQCDERGSQEGLVLHHIE